MKKDKNTSGQYDIRRDELPHDATEKDVRLYRALYQSLSTPPPSGLPADFAQRVAKHAIPPAHKVRPEYFASTTLWITLALLFSLVATYYVQTTLFEQLLKQVLQMKAVVLFSITALAFIQLSDYWLVKVKRSPR